MIGVKRVFVVLLCVSLLVVFAACGASSSAVGDTPSAASAESNQPDAQDPPSTLISAGSSASADEPAPSAPTSDVSPSATVVQNQSCFDGPYCFRPKTDGTYHFCAVTADDFQGKNAGYANDSITWSVYVLEEPFEGGLGELTLNRQPAILDLNSSVDISLKADEYVYCVCSLNSLTASQAADNSGTLTITPVETDFVPDADNNYQLSITVNSESRCDLDGDGKEETIYYSVQTPSLTSNAMWIGSNLCLEIDGVQFIHPDQDNPTEEYGFWMEGPDVAYYYIVDLDTSDNYREIALADWGSSDCLSTHYFRYADGALTYLGSSSGFPDDLTTVYHGDGSLSAMDRLNVLQTWSGLRTFYLENGALRTKENEFCQPVLPEGWSVTLLKRITVYESPDLASPTTTLQPSDSALSFPSTDGAHWVQIRCADGSGGWAYFSDFSTLLSGDETLSAFDVFGNLLLAG